ncbi:MAG: AbrB/MazE/SpoVT family DNA-binding domain-containing protein [Clostridia bacterium]|nr:AbrB/MazE/SpoVT family DNA-binding domain-containing protein [Clostridia bacterium]
MKATGIVRRIDDLGRVVIPKEIRRTLRIREGEPLEIFTDKDGEVIFKKYSHMAQLSGFATDCVESINKASGLCIAVCDRDEIVALAGASKKELSDRKISRELEELMEKRKTFAFNGESAKLYICPDSRYHIVCASPIISGGDVSGCVCIIAKDSESDPACSDVELKLTLSACNFLSRHLES